MNALKKSRKIEKEAIDIAIKRFGGEKKYALFAVFRCFLNIGNERTIVQPEIVYNI